MKRLLNSTNSAAADQAILDGLAFIQKEFPKPILSAYVTGSHANGYAVATSDVDLYLVFAENLSKEEETLANEIQNKIENIEPPLDVGFYGLPKMIEAGEIEMAKYFLHILGEPVHHLVPNPPIEDYAYRGMHVGYLRMGLTRKEKPYNFPLSFPREQETYKGYDWRTTTVGGSEAPSIKEIVVLTGWMATGLIAWQKNSYVPTKHECPVLFKELIGGQVADDFAAITELCRNKLKYLLPKSDETKEELIEILPRVLNVENYFLEQYQHFLIAQLQNQNPIRVRTSIIRLGEIIFPNSLSLEALKSLAPSNESQQQYLEKSLTQLCYQKEGRTL